MKTRIIITALLLLLIGMAVGQTEKKVAMFKVRKQEATFTKLVVKDTVVEVDFSMPEEESIKKTKASAPFGINQIFVSVEEPPSFPGGEDSLRSFIRRNANFSEELMQIDLQGRVYVRFCVTYEGKVNKVSILRGVHPLFDSAAVAVIRKLPKWKPGKQGGKAVNVWYTVPVSLYD